MCNASWFHIWMLIPAFLLGFGITVLAIRTFGLLGLLGLLILVIVLFAILYSQLHAQGCM